jgi:hypothetical protein
MRKLRQAPSADLCTEDLILEDFENGAKFGNRLASILAVQNNPYAAMCNAMLKEVMSDYQRK